MNEIKTSVFRFDSSHVEDFIELRAVNCMSPTIPVLQSYIILSVQLYFAHGKCPIVIRYVSLYHKTLKKHKTSVTFFEYFTIGQVTSIEKSSNHFAMTSKKSDFNWIDSVDYNKREVANFFTQQKAGEKKAKNYAFLLVNIDKSGADKKLAQKLQYMRISASKILVQDKAVAHINTQELIDFLLENTEDAIIFAPNTEDWNKHNFGQKLSQKLNKNVYNYDIRVEKTLSVNVCDNGLMKSQSSPGADNHCDGTLLETTDEITTTATTLTTTMTSATTMASPVVHQSFDNDCDSDFNMSSESDVEILEPDTIASNNRKRQQLDIVNNESSAANRSRTDAVTITIPVVIAQRDTSSAVQSTETASLSVTKQTNIVPWYDRTDHWDKTLSRFTASGLLSKCQISRANPFINFLEVVNIDLRDKIAIRCRICHKFRLEKQLCVDDNCNDADKSTLSALAKKDGYRGKNTMVMHKIKEHADMHSHKAAILYFKDKYESAREGTMLETDNQKDPTCCVLRTVYEEVKNNIAFNRHPDQIALQEINGVNCGIFHKSRTSAKEMTMSMSEVLHLKLLEMLKKQKIPISIIVDTSTDSMGRNLLMIYLRVFYSNWPHVFYYKTLHIKSEAAEAMFQDILKQLRKDDLEATIIQNLIGMATDGASVMTGEKNGLRAKFRAFTNNPLMPSIHCMAHKLELVVNAAFNQVVKDNNFNLQVLLIESINGIANYFGATSTKRKTTLVEKCENLGFSVYQFQRIFDARWMATQLTAINTVMRMYPCLWRTLEKIHDDPTVTEPRLRKNSADYLKRIKNANFYATLAFFQEVFHVMKGYSLHYQQHAAVLPGQKSKYFELLGKLESMIDQDGKRLEAAYEQISCEGDDRVLKFKEDCKVYLYDDKKRKFEGVVIFLNRTEDNIINDHYLQFIEDIGSTDARILSIDNSLLDAAFQTSESDNSNDASDADTNGSDSGDGSDNESDGELEPAKKESLVILDLSTYRKSFLRALIDKLKYYFDDDSLEEFEIMNPQLIKVNTMSIDFPDRSNEKHTQLARKFKINTHDIGNQLHDLYENVATKVSYELFKSWTTKPPEVFYANVLQAIDETIEITTELKYYIACTLTVPVGSADAERGFSILFHTLDKRRMLLTPETIDGILKIRINGPPTKEFYCKMYKDHWLANNHIESDNTARLPRGPAKKADDDELAEESDDPVAQNNQNTYFSNEMWQNRYNVFTPKHDDL